MGDEECRRRISRLEVSNSSGTVRAIFADGKIERLPFIVKSVAAGGPVTEMRCFLVLDDRIQVTVTP